MSEDGKLFRTDETIVVPGAKIEGGEIVASFTYVELIAAEPGEEYNINPSSFSIPGFKGTPKFLAFYGKSEEKMAGGRTAKVKVIAKSDYDNAKAQLEKELGEASMTSLSSLVPQDFVIPAESHEIGALEINSSHKTGDEAESFTISGKIGVKVFALREADVRALVSKDFETRFPDMRVLEESQSPVSYSVTSKDFSKGALDMVISVKEKAIASISIDEIKDSLKGKDEVEMRRFLAAYPGIEEARITFWPFWVNSIPQDSSKIEVIIENK